MSRPSKLASTLDSEGAERVIAKVDEPGGSPRLELDAEGNGECLRSQTYVDAETDDNGLINDDRLLRDLNLDPDVYEIIDGTYKAARWQVTMKVRRLLRRNANDRPEYEDVEVQHWNCYYSFRFKRRLPLGARVLDVSELSRRIRRKLPAKIKPASDERFLVVFLADWQTGKGEGGGTPALIERLRSLALWMKGRIAEAARAGRPYAGVALIGMGDLVEQCSGHYAMQTFGVDLDRRNQMNVTADNLLVLVDVAVDAGVEHIYVICVPGNHGENRVNGNAFTTWTDNDDLIVFDMLQRVCAANPDRYNHVEFSFPSEDDTPENVYDPLVMVVTIGGVRVAVTHGHLKKSGGHAVVRMEDWWRKQVMGNRPAATASILVSAHLHHFVASEATGRAFFQCPALDGGSYWWTAQAGASSPAGVLAMDVGLALGPRGFDNVTIAPCLPLGDN